MPLTCWNEPGSVPHDDCSPLVAACSELQGACRPLGASLRYTTRCLEPDGAHLALVVLVASPAMHAPLEPLLKP